MNKKQLEEIRKLLIQRRAGLQELYTICESLLIHISESESDQKDLDWFLGRFNVNSYLARDRIIRILQRSGYTSEAEELQDLQRASEELLSEEDREKLEVKEPCIACAYGVPSDAWSPEWDEFNIILSSWGANKMAVLKEVRTLLKMGLVESKALVDNLPSTLLEGVGRADAELIKAQFEEIGAKIDLISV